MNRIVREIHHGKTTCRSMAEEVLARLDVNVWDGQPA
jgi:hypothetical protein